MKRFTPSWVLAVAFLMLLPYGTCGNGFLQLRLLASEWVASPKNRYQPLG